MDEGVNIEVFECLSNNRVLLNCSTGVPGYSGVIINAHNILEKRKTASGGAKLTAMKIDDRRIRYLTDFSFPAQLEAGFPQLGPSKSSFADQFFSQPQFENFQVP